jgi:hypothetical protein
MRGVRSAAWISMWALFAGLAACDGGGGGQAPPPDAAPGSSADAAPDGDAVVRDGAAPDAAPDAALSDGAVPDAAVPDAALDPDAVPGDAGVEPRPLDPFFTTELVRAVDVEMAADDWAALRAQTRSRLEMFAGDCQAEPHESPFTYFPATVTVDGHRVENVGLRKKGWLGSLSATRPSFKMKTDEYVDGQDLAGLDDLILNNSLQDPSYVRQCLGYAIFAAAGIPSPRCGFARVHVNGEDLGLYVLLEAVDKDFLETRFADPTGNMYEAVMSDFREGWLGTFEPETNEDTADKGDLAAVVAALAQPDDTVLAALGEVVDVDQFITYWAVESLIRHGDGYARNANNYHVYRDPQTGLFVFLPHGIDFIMDVEESTQGPSTVTYARAALAKRLLDLPETRARFVERLTQLLESVWDPEALNAELDRLYPLLVEHAENTNLDEHFDRLRAFIDGRRGQIEAALAAGTIPAGELNGPVCWPSIGTFDGSFDVRLSTLFGGPPGTGTLAATVGEAQSGVQNASARAGISQGTGWASVVVTATVEGGQWRLELGLHPSRLAPGMTAMDWVTDAARLYRPNGMGGGDLFGFVGPATLTLESASAEDGATLRGTLSGTITEAR